MRLLNSTKQLLKMPTRNLLIHKYWYDNTYGAGANAFQCEISHRELHNMNFNASG